MDVIFCQECGYKMSTEAKFCCNCGSKVAFNINLTSKGNDNLLCQEFDSSVIKIYLYNVLAIECMRNKLARDWRSVDQKIKYEQSHNYIQRIELDRGYFCGKYNEDSSKFCWLMYNGKKCYIAFHGIEGYKSWINTTRDLTSCAVSEKLYWEPVEENFKYFENKSNWLKGYLSLKIDKERQKRVRDKFLEIYPKFKETAPEIYQKNVVKIQELMDKRSGIYKEWEETNELLKNAYDINVIPKQFRNLQAVYFIYDFISTSNETLTTALLHCDLDAIKQKLDIVIEQQEEIIIKQAIIIAQNERIVKQNQQTINRLANIERKTEDIANNTDRAVQYARIASNNAEACAWISLANYIKE